MVDELSSRRSSIQAGNLISLANDQEWTFPAPTADSEFAVEAAGTEYLGLIRAIMEAEDQSDRRLAELAMAIFLVGLNYQRSRSHPESGCILNRLPRNPRYFSVNSWMIVNISYDRYLSSRTVVDFGSCEVFSMVFV